MPHLIRFVNKLCKCVTVDSCFIVVVLFKLRITMNPYFVLVLKSER